MSDSTDGDAFWTWALDAYARPNATEIALALQDLYGASVVMVLACCWAATRGLSLSQETLAHLDAQEAPWRSDVTEPLRALRRDLKPLAAADPAFTALRDAIKQAELEAERLEIQSLGTAIAALDNGHKISESTPKDLADHNLRHYLRHIAAPPAATEKAIRLLNAVFGKVG